MNKRKEVVMIWRHNQSVENYPPVEDMTVEQVQEDFGLDRSDAYTLKLGCQCGADSAYMLGTDDPDEANRLAWMITESLHQGLDGWTEHEQFVITCYLNDIANAVRQEKEADDKK